MSKYYIYGRTHPPCPYCQGAKQLASAEKLEHVYIDIGKDIQMDEFREMFPEQRTVPLVFVEDKNGIRTKLGGFQEMKKYVSSLKTVGNLSL
jgi:glutaredoxin